MQIDTNLGYEYWIDVLASVTDNPADSISNKYELLEAISLAFGKSENSILGAVSKQLLFDDREPKWEIVSE